MNKCKYILMMVVLALSLSFPAMTASAAASRQPDLQLNPTSTVTATDQATSTVTTTIQPSATVTATPSPSSTVTATVQSTTTVTATAQITSTVTTTAQTIATVTVTVQPNTTVTATATTTIQPATNTPTLAITPLPATRIHIVRPGETLFCIGRAYQVWPFAIAEVNNIWWPYTIYPNQKLRIPTTVWSPIPAGPVCPAQFSTSMPPAATATVTATPIGGTTICSFTYYVRRGDTLYRIALRYGTNYTELARVNQIANPRLIYVGQRLCIP